jgi:hypothetical protein
MFKLQNLEYLSLRKNELKKFKKYEFLSHLKNLEFERETTSLLIVLNLKP